MRKSFLKLIRYPLFVTAGIDSATGYLVITPSPRVGELLMYATISCLLFIFGVTLNDLIDIEKDRHLGAKRPIATGKTSAVTAIITCSISLLVPLIVSAALLDYRQTYKVIAIITLILMYNFVFKELPIFNSISMGLVRAVNITLAHPLNSSLLYLPSITHFCYIFLCTNISFIEKKPRKKLLLAISIFSMAFYLLLLLYSGIPVYYSLFPVSIFILACLASLREMAKYGEIRSVPKLISLLVILDIFYLFTTDI